MLDSIFVKDGYQVTSVVATSFTYDHRLLGELLLQMYMANHELSLENGSLLNKLELLDKAHQEFQGKLHIYIHESGTPSAQYADAQTKNADRFLYQIRDTYVHPIPMETGYFHPKLILVQFAKGDEQCYRMMSSSKNLVCDTYHQLGCVLEGAVCHAPQTTGAEIQKLLKFVAFSGFSVENVQFFGESSMENLSVHVGVPSDTALKDALWADLKAHYSDHVFITDTINLAFPDGIAAKTMVTNNKSIRQDCKDKWSKPQGCALYSVNAGYNHAKTYLFHKENTLSVWTGSANCTINAYTNNVELMVHYSVFCDVATWEAMKKELLSQCQLVTKVPEKTAEETREEEREAIGQLTVQCEYEGKQLQVQLLDPQGILSGKELYFALPLTPKKYELVDKQCTVPISPFNAPCLQEKIGFLILPTEPDMAPIPVTLTFSNMTTVEAVSQAALAKTYLYTGILPTLRGFIPATTKGGIPYHPSDSAETRLAKYLCNGGEYGQVSAVLERFLGDNATDVEGTDSTELQRMLQEVQEFQRLLEG